MIQSIIIRPIDSVNGTITLTGEYTDQRTGITFCLTTTDEVKDKSKMAMQTINQGGNILAVPVEKIKDEVFDANRNSLTLSFDEKAADNTSHPEYIKNYKMRRVVEFYMLHPLCTPLIGKNPNLISAHFSIENTANKVRETVKNIELKGKVYNRVNSMTLAQKLAVACWIGINPKDIRSHSQLYSALLDDATGALVTGEKTHNGKNIPTAKYFLDVYNADDANIEMLVTARRAVTYGIIEKKDGNYYISGAFAGATEETLIDYLRLNTDIYEGYVQSEVNKRGVKGIEDDMNVTEPVKEEQVVKQTAPSQTVQDYEAEKKVLVDRAKELGIVGAHLSKDLNKLRAKIAKVEKELEIA